MACKQLTILHSNDLHGDFLPHENEAGERIGGLARLAGYVRQTRRQERNTLFVIAGDLFRGSIIDREYRGLSTIELINGLDPDVVTIGNHEVDYGLAHLLFLEKCATFPIINANMFITTNNARLFEPYRVVEMDGMRIMFIGILTDEVLASTKQEGLIGSFVDIEEAAREVGIICDSYRTIDVDLTVLVTHIGIEQDRALAEKLDPEWGVDLIIGGHSHTFMDEPEWVNGIPIVQAGKGTGQIGRLDLTVNTDTDDIEELDWRCVTLDRRAAAEDPLVSALIDRYRGETDEKYRRVVTHFARQLTHPRREQETELGNLYADLMIEGASYQIMFFASGSIRKEKLGPVVDLQELVENTPFDDAVWMFKVTGAQLRRMMSYMLRDEAWEGHTEFYQVSRGLRMVWNKTTHTMQELTWQGKPVADDDEFTCAMQDYHFGCFEEFMGIPAAEIEANMEPRVVITSILDVIEERLARHPGLDAKVEGRITVVS